MERLGRRASWAWVIGLLAAVPVSAGTWPLLGGNVARTSATSETLSHPLAVAWRGELKGQPLSGLSSDGRLIFVGTNAATVVAVDIASGKTAWTYKAGDRIHSTPAVEGGVVYVASYDRHLYALDASRGSLLWKAVSGGNEMSSPAVAGGLVYVSSGFPNTKLLAFNPTGRLAWERDLGQMSYSSPAVAGDTLLVGSNNGRLIAVDRTSGKVLWTHTTRGSVMLSSPTVTPGGTALFAPGGEDPNVYAVSVATGKPEWVTPLIRLAQRAPSREVAADTVEECLDPDADQRQGGECTRAMLARQKAGKTARAPSKPSGPESVLTSQIAVAGETAFVMASAGTQKLFALSLANGTIRWSVEVGIPSTPAFSSSPLVAGPTVYVGTGNGELAAVNAADGTKLPSLALDGSANTPLAVVDGKLFVATEAGTLFALK
ncbi:MAG: PQQ-binding-like beta-propeller repeat protein [Nitrospirae bacterium]|nr:PQQ-binding-like beta-propeller repeat protein [Nitrospirota bacterium]